MNTGMVLSLINNAALLIVLVVIYDFIFFHVDINTRLKSVVTGIIIGIIGIAVMLNPWELSSGLFYDTRSILLSVVALFFGFVPAFIGALFVIFYRLYQGGVGAIVGTSVTLFSILIGLLWRHYHEKLQKFLGIFDLYVFGILVHVVMLICMLLLPWSYAFEVIRRISLPVMLIYPVGTVLLGSLLKDQMSRKETRIALEKTEKKYRQAYNILQEVIESPKDVVIFALDTDYRYIAFNKNHQVTMEKIWGVRIKADVSMLTYIKDPLDREKAKVNFDRALAGEAFEIVEEYGDSLLERRWYENVYSPLEGDEGNIIGLSLILTDISERKEHEMALVKAKLLAEESSRTKSEFLGNMSHELRTPLNSILGFSQVLIDKISGDLNEKQLHYVSNIQKSGNHLLEVINDILDMSKIEYGAIECEPENVNIQQMIGEVGSLMEPVIEKKHITFDVNIENEPVDIYVDEIKIKQIMYNLLSNAIKFTHEGGKIWIDVKRVNDDIQISVSDNGIGIPINEQNVIFNPFKQVNSSENRVHGGTGLGLAIVKHYVEMHNGEIHVESEVDKGSAFIFTIPINHPVNEDVKHIGIQ